MPRATEHILMSAEEYLEFERQNQNKHEFVDGLVFAMAGGSEAHNLISGAVYIKARLAAATNTCRVYMEGVKLKVPSGNYYYPDVFIACNPNEFGQSVKTDACLVVEVLSKGTADIDRGEKLHSYRRLASLQAYILLSQDKVMAELYRRLADGSWRYEVIEEGHLLLPCLDLSIDILELYEGVFES